MYHVDSASLDDLHMRTDYLRTFINFTADDAAVLHVAKDIVAPLVPSIVDTVYIQLLPFDITASAFVPRQTGYIGDVPTKLDDLTLEHLQIKFRKDFLSGYLVKLVTMDYAKAESWAYLDKVGLMHTGAVGFKHWISRPTLCVEYIHCAIFLGLVEDILIDTILWIQNDLFARHYIKEERNVDAVPSDTITVKKSIAVPAALALLLLGAVYMKNFPL
ncbi:hypothetical protein NLJ89_g5387 [Agrocybe chaxingu]|uniref:Globin-sensor domain-containing protein n=1 Tax=Agrocybe chaxingu TaxID=84603 RepID=A0A9W8K7C2_9AGAR|nr:hypothetical protein NLJ89_g5387 [Agrocybe chaxingu]